ncbi:MAG TPA: homocysteine S-methyltransferase [Solirubrobacteraceae bacterium]|nr:homocysteine S-methyltransferase [Solirubrobacteraceae bacterium]
MTPNGLATMLQRGPVVLDGGLATELEARGHDLAGPLWSARLLRDRPGDIEGVHRAYFEAGADVAITASYQASYEGFAAAGIGRDETTRLLRLGVELARHARDAVRPDGLVAASVGPYAAVLADGSEYTGDYGPVTTERLAAVHRPRIAALLGAKPDVLAFETIPSIREVAALVELLAEFSGVEAWMTFCCRDGERLSDGTPVEEAVRLADGSGRLVAVGINCTPPEHIEALLERARATTGLPLLVYPNRGRTWDGAAHEWRGAGVDGFAPAVVTRWRERGARGIGGCCGIGPDTIAGVARTLRG